MNTKIFQRWQYLVLLLLAGVFGLVYWCLPTAWEGWRGFALNLASELVAILFVLVLIEGVLRRREEREQKRYRSLALRRLRIPLNRHLHLLFSIYKASAQRKPEREISGVADLFDEDFFEQVAHLDGLADGHTVRGIGGGLDTVVRVDRYRDAALQR